MKTKPCRICGADLELPEQYLDSIRNLRKEVEKFRDVIIKDFIHNDLKPVLFEILKSHSQLAQAEYNRNPSYNNEHFSHKTEESILNFLKEIDLLDEFLKSNIKNVEP